MGDPADLEVDQYIASQQPVVEDEIDDKMIAVECETALPGLEQESLPEFEQELFYAADNGGFEIGF